MFDSCVLYNVSDEEKKLLKIRVGNAKIRDKLNFNKKDLIFFNPNNSEMLRKAIDMTMPFGIINSELIHPKDSLHYPRAGIDDTIGKIMGEKKIAIVFNLNLLITNTGEKRAKIIRRMKENMRRAKKYDIPVLFASCATNKYELFNSAQIKAWANYLGIDTFERVKNSFNKIFN